MIVERLLELFLRVFKKTQKLKRKKTYKIQFTNAFCCVFALLFWLDLLRWFDMQVEKVQYSIHAFGVVCSVCKMLFKRKQSMCVGALFSEQLLIELLFFLGYL